ncbi:MAG: PEGA domain-containing protein [Deltaproteobacteria bacterium]|nr:PEGA domain-containing protein [Deltaproteobacteria bacterium]
MLVAVLALPGPLAAQPAPSGDPVEQARSHMERGQILYVQGRYIESAEEFMRAFEFQPFSAFLYNAGVSYERFGDGARAAELFTRYLESDPNAADRADVQARIERLRAMAPPDPNRPPDNPPPDGPPGPANPPPPENVQPPENVEGMKSVLSVQTNPSGAEITVRDSRGNVVATGPSPFAHTLDRGSYTIETNHPEFRRSQTEPIEFTAGIVHIVRVELAQGAFLGLLRVISTVPGSKVLIDDRAEGPHGVTPLSEQLTIGHHRIWVERPGWRPVETEVDVTLSRPVTVRVPQERIDEGRLDIRANVRGAKVYVDAHEVGRVPMTHEALAGPHIVWVEADGYKDWEGTVTLEHGRVTRVDVEMQPAVSRTPGFIAAGLTIALVTGATIVGLHANGIDDDLARDRKEGRLTSNDPRVMEGLAWAIGADAGFLLGGVIGIFAVYYFLRDPYEDSGAESRRPVDYSLVPTLGPGTAGLSLGGAL